MKYINEYLTKPFTGKELTKGSKIMKKEFPNGPAVKTYQPDKIYSFNEIANHIRTSYQQVSKSIYG